MAGGDAGQAGRGGAPQAGFDGLDSTAAPSGRVPDAPSGGTETSTCAPPAVEPLFAASEATPIVERREDGVIVTRGAGRVRGRHELEAGHSPYHALYFENRSYGFVIEDAVAAGGDTVKFTYLPEAPVSMHGATTNFRYWKVLGDGNVFHANVGMDALSPRRLEHVVTRNARAGRAMQAGDVLEFEFGIFITGNNAADPDAIDGRTAYYTDTFRYRVGEGGLIPSNTDPSGRPGPAREAWLAGDTTVPWLYAEPELAFSQMALNIQAEHVQPFLRGRRLFHTDFGTGAHSEPGNPALPAQSGKLGPLFSANGCVDCHARDGRGQLPEIGAPLTTLVVKLYGPAALGNQLQAQEGQAIHMGADLRELSFADGHRVMLQAPRFALEGVADEALMPSIRVARQIPGMGLLEAIAESTVLARADADDCDRNGISGRAQRVLDPAGSGRMLLGRFGWKAEKVSVAHQVADALEADMGVTTKLLPEADGGAELSDADFDDLVTYTQLLGLPGRRDTADPEVQAGEALFGRLGCINCHVPSTTTGSDHPLVELRDQTIYPYTDLLLHDMGPDLADDSGTPQASEWRTPPLWGLGLIETVSGHGRLLHDGRARDPLEAVLWYGGEAAFAREGVLGLSADERAALLAFLSSL